MIKKVTCLLVCTSLVSLFAGCANQPIRSFFRGAFCNTCQPPVGQPLGCGTNYAPACDACGTGVIGQPSTEFQVAPSQPLLNNGPVIQTPNFNAVPVETDPFAMPESANVYGNNVGNAGTPTAPSIGPQNSQ